MEVAWHSNQPDGPVIHYHILEWPGDGFACGPSDPARVLNIGDTEQLESLPVKATLCPKCTEQETLFD